MASTTVSTTSSTATAPQRTFNGTSDKPPIVVRINHGSSRRRTKKEDEPPTPVTPTEPKALTISASNRFAGSLGVSTGEASTLQPHIEAWAKAHEDVLRKYEIDTVEIHGSNHTTLTSSNLGECTKAKGVLHFFNWTMPGGIVSSDLLNATKGTTPDPIVDSEAVRLSSGQSDGYIQRAGYVDFRKNPHWGDYTVITDDNPDDPQMLAWMRDDHRVLTCTFDIMHSSGNLHILIPLILDKAFALRPMYAKMMPMREIHVDEAAALIKKSLPLYADTSSARDATYRARREMDEAWRIYLETMKRKAADIRRLVRANLTDEQLNSKAAQVVANINSNPFVLGAYLLKSNRLRIITKAIPSHYWHGIRNIVIDIPLFMGATDTSNIFIKELTSDDRMVNAPRYNNVLYEDGHICPGSMGNKVIENVLTGDWDITVAQVIRGLIGDDSAMRQWMKIYHEAKRDMTAEDKKNRVPLNLQDIYNKDGGSSDGDMEDDDDGEESEEEEDDP